jgi:hypothetical protein
MMASVVADASADDPAALERLAELASALADGIEDALPRWVVGSVEGLTVAWQGSVPPEVSAAATSAGRAARDDIVPAVRALLATDVDEQRTNPLALLRGAVAYPTAVLIEAGVPEVVRDPFAEQVFPDDVYDLAPAGFGDLDPDLHDAGLAWGAAKAFVVLNRRKAEGRR